MGFNFGNFIDAINPGGAYLADIAGRNDFLDTAILFDPGANISRNVSMASREGNWGNPFGDSEAQGQDFMAGGPQAEHPSNRRVGRAFGQAAATWGLGNLFGASSGASAGGETLSGMDVAADAPDLYSGNGAFSSGAGSSDFYPFADDPGFDPTSPSGFNPFEDPDFFSQPRFAGSNATPTFGENMMNRLMPGEQGGTPRSVWEEMMRKRGRFPMMDIASGIYGMGQAGRMERASRDADPMSGYRAQYAGQLAQLAANPNQITSMPGYTAGQQAIERRLASQGYLGSGNMMQAMGNYGGDFFNKEIARLTSLATPSSGAIESRVAGQNAASNQRGRSLASIGYGLWNMF